MKKVFVFSVLFLFFVTTAHANLIQNGSFEDTTNKIWTYSNVDWWTGWNAKDGRVSIDVSGSGAGWIAQSFATEIGAKYTVSFWLAGNPQGLPKIKTLSVSAGDISDLQFTFDTTGKSTTNMGWTEEIFDFTALGTTTTLKFQSHDSTYYGPAIDLINVDKAVVPLPPAILLLAPGLIGIIGLKRRLGR